MVRESRRLLAPPTSVETRNQPTRAVHIIAVALAEGGEQNALFGAGPQVAAKDHQYHSHPNPGCSDPDRGSQRKQIAGEIDGMADPAKRPSRAKLMAPVELGEQAPGTENPERPDE